MLTSETRISEPMTESTQVAIALKIKNCIFISDGNIIMFAVMTNE